MSATNGFGHPTATALNNIHAQNTTVYWTTSGAGASPGGLDVIANNTVITEVPAGGTTFTVRYGSTTHNYSSWAAPTCSYTLTPTSASVSSAGGTATVAVTTTAGCAWTAASNVGFVTVTSGASGTGSGTVGYSVASATAARSGTITIGGLTFTITQTAPPTCSYSLTPTSASFSASGGSASVTVTTTAGCAWTATSNAGFVSVTSGASGAGTGSVGYAVALGAAPRTATMTIAGLTFQVSQVAPPFTDSSLTAESSLIRAVHITELRTRIDALRARYALSTFTWTDTSLDGVFMKAVHITELRTALADVYTAAGADQPTYVDGTVTAGLTSIRAVHIVELRSAVIAVE